MKNPVKGPPEWKVAIPTTLGGIITVLTLALHEYVPGFHPPSAALVAGIVTTVYGIAGYLAPHTSRLRPLPADATVTLPTSPAPNDPVAASRALLERAGVPPAQEGPKP